MDIKVDNIGDMLKNARLSKDMLLKDVSKISNLSSGYISRMENGSSKPSLEALKILCKVYSLNINDYVENADDTELNGIHIKDFLLNNNLIYNEKEISIKEKLNLLRFMEFIENSSEDLVDIYLSLLENLNKFNKKEDL